MTVHAGTSGYAYDFWKGTFYPEAVDTDLMLAHYSRQLPCVEINNTFYRMPKSNVVERWASSVPSTFRFAIKASRRITHQAKLADCGDSVDYLYSTLSPLGDALGAVLFQCPPSLRKDIDLLESFLATLPDDARAVLEFRHASWFDDEVYARLREAGVGLCIGDYGDDQTPLVSTSKFGYLRLRREDYGDDELREWMARIEAQWDDAYVFFKHEETAPFLAERLMSLRP